MTEQSRTPTLAELLDIAIESKLRGLHVALPGRIDSYDLDNQRVDVQPLLQRTPVASDGTELAVETLPILHDVPLVFPRGGGFFMSLPVVAGDLVLLVFVERSMDVWLDGQGDLTKPLDFRRHNLSDAVAIPGLYPLKRPLADAHAENLVVGLDGSSAAHFRPDGEIHLGSDGAADYVALAQLVKDEITALRNTVNSFVTAYNAHIHTTTATVGPSAVPGIIAPTTSSASAPSAVGDVKADKVKAD